MYLDPSSSFKGVLFGFLGAFLNIHKRKRASKVFLSYLLVILFTLFKSKASHNHEQEHRSFGEWKTFVYHIRFDSYFGYLALIKRSVKLRILTQPTRIAHQELGSFAASTCHHYSGTDGGTQQMTCKDQLGMIFGQLPQNQSRGVLGVCL